MGIISVSEAFLIINGGDPIALTLDSSGQFSVTMSFQAIKDAVYNIELWASDTYPEENGGPNTGLVDQTSIRVR